MRGARFLQAADVVLAPAYDTQAHGSSLLVLDTSQPAFDLERLRKVHALLLEAEGRLKALPAGAIQRWLPSPEAGALAGRLQRADFIAFDAANAPPGAVRVGGGYSRRGRLAAIQRVAQPANVEDSKRKLWLEVFYEGTAHIPAIQGRDAEAIYNRAARARRLTVRDWSGSERCRCPVSSAPP